MDVERQPGRPAERANHRGADGQVRDEVPVHDVDVNQIGSSGLGLRQCIRQAREVGSQEGRRDPHAHECGTTAASGGRETVSETTSRLDSG